LPLRLSTDCGGICPLSRTRSRRGRWYPLVSVLLICACAVVSGARTIDETTEWGWRASTDLLCRLGIRRHLPSRCRAPPHPTIARIPARVDGDALAPGEANVSAVKALNVILTPEPDLPHPK
jgi:hypothetical protein